MSGQTAEDLQSKCVRLDDNYVARAKRIVSRETKYASFSHFARVAVKDLVDKEE